MIPNSGSALLNSDPLYCDASDHTNPAVSQVLQGIAYGAALWLIFTSPDTSLAIPLGILAVLLLLEYEKFFGKVLPMFFNGVAAFVRGEHYEGPTDDLPVDIETGT